jgi:hypothetical protein
MIQISGSRKPAPLGTIKEKGANDTDNRPSGSRAQGISAEEYARQVLAHVLDSQPRHIWDEIAENMKRVPEEDLALLPADGAGRIDHYVYGVPKNSE